MLLLGLILPMSVLPRPYFKQQRSFADLCKSSGTDKCNRNPVMDENGQLLMDNHQYENVYSKYLAPLRSQHVKLLEIGLGCDMKYGPGRSYKLWRAYFESLDLWMSEFNDTCAQHFLSSSSDHILIGDAGNVSTLRQWRRIIGPDTLDVIIDDGSHKSEDQLNALRVLLPVLKPGGIYAIEDLQHQRDHNGLHSAMLETLRSWSIDLVGSRRVRDNVNRTKSKMFTVPKAILSIDCFHDMCSSSAKLNA